MEEKKKTKKKTVELNKTLMESISEIPQKIKPIKSHKIQVKFLDNDEMIFTPPKYAHDGDIGMDVVATHVEYDRYNDCYIYGTDFKCETKKGYGAFLMPRSSNYKKEAFLPNSIGLIDAYQYRGEWKFIYKNRDSLYSEAVTEALLRWTAAPWYTKLFINFSNYVDEVYEEFIDTALQRAPYHVGDKIGQIVWMPFQEAVLKPVKNLTETDRGEGGFGSTGK